MGFGMNNCLADIPAALATELIETLAKSAHVLFFEPASTLNTGNVQN